MCYQGWEKCARELFCQGYESGNIGPSLEGLPFENHLWVLTVELHCNFNSSTSDNLTTLYHVW